MTAAERTGYIGGSDFTDILSLEPYGCRRKAYLRKIGEFPGVEETGNMKRGKKAEALAAAEYEELTGREVWRKKTIADTVVPYFAANIDRHIVSRPNQYDSDGQQLFGPGVLEIKCPSDWVFRQVRREGLHQGYIAQLQWYMRLTGWRWGSYAIFNLNSWSLLYWDVRRDNELIVLLEAKAHEFWRSVESGTAPLPLDKSDRRCKSCPARVKCHGEEPLPEVPEGKEIVRDDSLAPLVDEYAEALTIRDEAEQLVEGVEQQLRERTKGKYCVEAPGMRFYNIPSAGRWSFDWAAAKKKYPRLSAAAIALFGKTGKAFTTFRHFQRSK